jgi:hypothetical protein
VSRVSAPAQPQDDEHDEAPGFKRVMSSAAKAGFVRPEGVARSVFDQVPRAPKKPKAPRRYDPLPDVMTIALENGVAIPSAKHFAGKVSAAALLLERMQPGQSVVLTETQARSVRSNAKRMKVPVAVRVVGDGKARLWRLKPGTDGAQS